MIWTMGRPPIGKIAMTSAERVRKHRAKQRAEADVTKPVTKPAQPDQPADTATIRGLKRELAERDRMIAELQRRRPTKAGDRRIEELQRENFGLKVQRDDLQRSLRERLAGDTSEAERFMQVEIKSLRAQVAHWKAEANREPNAEIERLRGLLRKRVRLGPKTIKSIQFCLHPDRFKTDVEKEHAERAFKWFGSLGIEPKPE
jgi:hypothetical protein